MIHPWRDLPPALVVGAARILVRVALGDEAVLQLRGKLSDSD